MTPTITAPAWLTAVGARIATEPSAAVRTRAWAHVAHTIALAHVLRADPATPSAATFVEPHLAWADDALADAGITVMVGVDVSDADLDLSDDVAVREALIVAITGMHTAATDRALGAEPTGHVRARTYAARRAGSAMVALNRFLP